MENNLGENEKWRRGTAGWFMPLIYVALLFLVLAAFSVTVFAAGDIYIEGVNATKPMTCTNATTRTDGTALPVNQIIRVEIGFTNNADGTGATIFKVLPGGCTNPGTLDLSLLAPLGYGQKYEVGWTVACDTVTVGGVCTSNTEKYSVLSTPLPFEWRQAQVAKPAPPVLTK
jgi:hypothetical protein